MSDQSAAIYMEMTYDSGDIGYGERPGIIVVDFQTGFTDPQYPLGGAALIERAVGNTARLLEVARRCDVPVASCYTAYSSKRDMPYWKVSAIGEDLIHGHPSTEIDPRIRDADYDVAFCKSGASIFFHSLLGLVELVLAKAEPDVHRFYESVLAPPAADSLGSDLQHRFAATVDTVLETIGHQHLLEANPVIRRSIDVRNPYVDPINVLQAGLLKLFRQTHDARVRDALHITINGIAAGLRNTG